MEIGTKIRNARIDAMLSQEQSAEALGVSRQTISNWENEKTYPDIISVLKMSDLYSISLDRLLKEELPMKQGFTEYLEESTNVVKSKNKLSIVILISIYLFIFSASEIVLWLFAPGSSYATVFNIIFLYTLLPITIFIISFLIGKFYNCGKKRWGIPVLFGIMSMLIPYSNFIELSSKEASSSFNFPNLYAFPIGIVVSLAGLTIGVILHSKERCPN